MQGTIGKKIMFFQKTVEAILAKICWGIMLTCRAHIIYNFLIVKSHFAPLGSNG